jgi:hypothetical protein
MLPAANHGGGNMAGAAITNPAGCPESNLVMSGAGPCGVIAQGVWQSLQPEVVTIYFPRSAVGATDAVESTPGAAFLLAQPTINTEIAIAASAPMLLAECGIRTVRFFMVLVIRNELKNSTIRNLLLTSVCKYNTFADPITKNAFSKNKIEHYPLSFS